MLPLKIIEQPIVSASLDKAKNKIPRFDDYWVRGVSWILVRDPFIGAQVPDINPPRYAWGVAKFRAWKIPRLSIVYRHYQDEGQILLERLTVHDYE